MKLSRLVVAGAVAALVLSGCADIGKEQPAEADQGMIPQLLLPADLAGNITGEALANYNPLSPNVMAADWIYEPLMIRNTFSCEAMPWLATGYEWRDPTTLALTIREGVKWSDGTDFTPDDVVWNIEARKEYPGADKAAIWTHTLGGAATGVRAEGNDVIITFDGPAPAKTDSILELNRMLPKHIYSTVGDITKYVDKLPVGTGPFVVKDFNGRKVSLERNPTYWQADKVRVQSLSLEGKYEANAAALKLRNGGLDLWRGDIPNPEKSVRKVGEVDYYYSPAGTTVVNPNNEKGPTADPKLREALAYAVNAEEASEKASYGVMKPASQTMLKLPVQADALPEKYRETGGLTPYDPETRPRRWSTS